MKNKKALILELQARMVHIYQNFCSKKNIKFMVKRRSSTINTQRINDIYKDINLKSNFVLFYGDLTMHHLF